MKTNEQKIKKAKEIIANIFNLVLDTDGYTPKGYGNYELNKATDAMYEYIKVMTSNPEQS